MERSNPSVSFWPHATSLRTASYRIRCRNIVNALRKLGFNASVYEIGRPKPDILVLSKRVDLASANHATELKKHGVKIILDLCDNMFPRGPSSNIEKDGAKEISNLFLLCDAVVFATPDLMDVMTSELKLAGTAFVIGDAIEPPDAFDRRSFYHTALDFLRLSMVSARMKLDGIPKDRRLIWFGMQGARDLGSGMYDLAKVSPHLDKLNRKMPISLTVVSNNFKIYRELFSNQSFTTYYTTWSARHLYDVSKMHSISLIPVSLNNYTIGKTNNRLVTSLLNNLIVAASSLPAYKDFSNYVHLDKFDQLEDLIENRNSWMKKTEDGKKFAMGKWSLDEISKQWSALLTNV